MNLPIIYWIVIRVFDYKDGLDLSIEYLSNDDLNCGVNDKYFSPVIDDHTLFFESEDKANTAIAQHGDTYKNFAVAVYIESKGDDNE